MERHLAILAILVRLWGALAVLVGASMLLLAGGAASLLADTSGQSVAFAAGLTAATFAAIGIFALVWGGGHVWAAARLLKHDPTGRILTLALALVNLLILPFGTALGVYAMWVLLTNDGRRIFEHHPHAATH